MSNSVYLTPKRKVCKQSLSGEEEKCRSQAGNKCQNFEQISFIPSFQDGRSKRIKYLLQQNDYMCKIGLKDVYFSIPLHIGRKPVRIIMSSF